MCIRTQKHCIRLWAIT